MAAANAEALTSETDRCRLCGGPGRPWRTKAGYPIPRCSACGNAFVPDRVVPPDLEEIYARAYFEGGAETGYPTYLADQRLLERNFARRARWIGESVAPGRVLDVGSAYGFFLKAAREAGWEAVGVEIAADCAEASREIAGAPVVVGDFLEAELPGPFDAVTMFDVLEHMRDPARCVARARELLAPGGVLVVETGDLGAPWARALGRHWYFLDPPQHLAYFTARGLEDLARRQGFAGACRVRRLGRWVSLANVAFKLGKRFPIAAVSERILERARRGLPGAVYLNFGDTVLLAVQRD